MAYDVSSWFQSQLEKPFSQPKNVLTVAGSDYSESVISWPSFERTTDQLSSVEVSINLDNTAGGYNDFYAKRYTINTSASIQTGFTHPTSGDELLTVYAGYLKDVTYASGVCKLTFRDRIYDFATKTVGDSDNPVTFSNIIPSDIAWTLCTCYGGLSGVESTSNTDIDYDSFLTWAGVFSTDTVLTSAQYEGLKVTEALNRIADYTNSAIWCNGQGLIEFEKFIASSSLDTLYTEDEYIDIEVNVSTNKLVNRQYVYFDYSPASDYWQKSVVSVDSTSVNSYGIHEDVIKDDTIWYVNSVSAVSLSQRNMALKKDPPRSFEIRTPWFGIQTDIPETVRLVNSFYDITSSSAWRCIEQKIDLDTFSVNLSLTSAAALNAFYLDVSFLDGDDLLL